MSAMTLLGGLERNDVIYGERATMTGWTAMQKASARTWQDPFQLGHAKILPLEFGKLPAN